MPHFELITRSKTNAAKCGIRIIDKSQVITLIGQDKCDVLVANPYATFPVDSPFQQSVRYVDPQRNTPEELGLDPDLMRGRA